MLLLFAVRMVRTGIERVFGASFRRHVTGTDKPVTATTTGIFLAKRLEMKTGFC